MSIQKRGGRYVVRWREAGRGLAWLHDAGRGFTGHRVNDLGHQAWIGLFEPLRAAADSLKPGLASTIEGDLLSVLEDLIKPLRDLGLMPAAVSTGVGSETQKLLTHAHVPVLIVR